MEAIITEINAWAWGVPMQVLLLGTGVFLTIGLGFLTWKRLGFAFRLLLGGFKGQGEGDIPPFRALMTSLSATIGTGNIAGVATAMTLGGPGALFWMWLTALFGMAMKYAEAVLAVRYREQDDQGGFSGGPMYYIRNGLGPRYAILGAAFALFGSMAGFGLANTVQSNSVAQVLGDQFHVPWAITGVVLMIVVGAVILGGIQRIAATASAVVPAMAIAYVLMSLVVIGLHIDQVPAAIATIVDNAFNGSAATGGFAGATVWAAIRFGVARGIFSNEAGLGSAPIAHAAAKTNQPVEQGLVAMLGTFIDTLSGMHDDRAGDYAHGGSGLRYLGRQFDSVCLRRLDPWRRVGCHNWCRAVRHDDNDRLVVLRRAMCGLPFWYSRHLAFSYLLGGGYSGWRGNRSGFDLAGCGHAQCFHGYSELDRAITAITRGVPALQSLL